MRLHLFLFFQDAYIFWYGLNPPGDICWPITGDTYPVFFFQTPRSINDQRIIDKTSCYERFRIWIGEYQREQYRRIQPLAVATERFQTTEIGRTSSISSFRDKWMKSLFFMVPKSFSWMVFPCWAEEPALGYSPSYDPGFPRAAIVHPLINSSFIIIVDGSQFT